MISIITVTYNSEDDISSTIESVLKMDGTEYEYIIKDGGSSDKTVDVAHSYDDQFKKKGINYIVVSSTDNGIYDAMNQAIDYTSGDIINFLNSGDRYYSSDIISTVTSNMNPAVDDVVYGDTAWILKNHGHYIYVNNHNKLSSGRGLNQQAAFYNKRVFESRRFDTAFKILGDFEFFLYLIQNNYKYKKLNSIVVKYNRYGVSSIKTIEQQKEKELLRKKYQVPFMKKNAIRLWINECFNMLFPSLNEVLTCFHDMNTTL